MIYILVISYYFYMKFNIIATTDRGLEIQACNELKSLLKDLGDSNAIVNATNILGLIIAETSLDPFKIIEDLKKIYIENPDKIFYLKRVIPIQVLTETNIEKIVKATLPLINSIKENETFRITVEKRRTNISSMDIIKAVAALVNRKVNLENPDKIILIEIIGKYAGISIIKNDQIFNVHKL